VNNPTTAEQLLAAYPSVDVFRDATGRVIISPAKGPHAPGRPFYTMLGIAVHRLMPRESRLDIKSSTTHYVADKALAVPVLGTLAQRKVVRAGEISDVDVLDMARKGVGLLAAFRQLPKDERSRLGHIQTQNLPSTKVWDLIHTEVPDITEETIDGIPYAAFAQSTLSVARRILFED
jgi:hypothetical protein